MEDITEDRWKIIVDWNLNEHCTVNTVRCTLYAEHCTLYAAHCTLYTEHCTLYVVR